MNRVPQPQEEKLGNYFQSETCPGAIFSKLFLSVVCKRPVINVTLITLKIPTKKTRPIGYFPIVLMKLFELYTFQLDIYIIETKLFHFHRICKNGGAGRGFRANTLNPHWIRHWIMTEMLFGGWVLTISM